VLAIINDDFACLKRPYIMSIRMMGSLLLSGVVTLSWTRNRGVEIVFPAVETRIVE
jgi:hypothetical protein